MDTDEATCPDCGKTPHNPKTGFCWLSTSRSPRAGFHCTHCCTVSTGNRSPR